MNPPEASFPGPETLLPHGKGMIFLDRILRHDSESTVCRVIPGGSDLEPDSGPLRPWVGIEYMGQTASVHTVLASEPTRPLRVGLLIGARDLNVTVDRLPRGQALLVRAQTLLDQGTLRSMQCSLRLEAEDRLLMKGRLNAYIPEEPEDVFGEAPG